MTLKYSPICDDPKKYPQNLHTPKNIHFSEAPKTTEIQNFEPQKLARAYLCMKIPEPPPPPPPPSLGAGLRLFEQQRRRPCNNVRFSRDQANMRIGFPLLCVTLPIVIKVVFHLLTFSYCNFGKYVHTAYSILFSDRDVTRRTQKRTKEQGN